MNQAGNVQQVRLLLNRIGQEWWGAEPGVLPVPYIAHGASQAIPAALSMIMSYYGHPASHVMTDELQSAQWCEWDLPRILAAAVRGCGMDAAVTAGRTSLRNVLFAAPSDNAITSPACR